MTIRIVHQYIMHVIIDAIIFVLYVILLNMHATLVITIRDIKFTKNLKFAKPLSALRKICVFSMFLHTYILY